MYVGLGQSKLHRVGLLIVFLIGCVQIHAVFTPQSAIFTICIIFQPNDERVLNHCAVRYKKNPTMEQKKSFKLSFNSPTVWPDTFSTRENHRMTDNDEETVWNVSLLLSKEKIFKLLLYRK